MRERECVKINEGCQQENNVFLFSDLARCSCAGLRAKGCSRGQNVLTYALTILRGHLYELDTIHSPLFSSVTGSSIVRTPVDEELKEPRKMALLRIGNIFEPAHNLPSPLATLVFWSRGAPLGGCILYRLRGCTDGGMLASPTSALTRICCTLRNIGSKP